MLMIMSIEIYLSKQNQLMARDDLIVSLEHIEWTKTMLLTPAQIKTINMLSGGEPFWTIEIDEAGKPSIVLDDSKYDPTDYEDDED